MHGRTPAHAHTHTHIKIFVSVIIFSIILSVLRPNIVRQYSIGWFRYCDVTSFAAKRLALCDELGVGWGGGGSADKQIETEVLVGLID